MVKVVEAVYENGVFKPLEKVELKDGKSKDRDKEEHLRNFEGLESRCSIRLRTS